MGGLKPPRYPFSRGKTGEVETSANRGWYLRLSVAAVGTVLATVGVRGYIVRSPPDQSSFNLLKVVLRAAAGSAYDVAVIGGLTAAFFLLLAVQKGQSARYVTYYVFLVSASFLLLAGILNARLMDVLHRPFNYQWLQYSDFLRSIDAREAIKSSITTQFIVLLVTVISSLLLISIHLGNWLTKFAAGFRVSERRIGCFVLCGFFMWAVVGHAFARFREWPYEKLANPVYAFAYSWFISDERSSLFTMKTPIGPDEFKPPARTAAPGRVFNRSAIQNVIVFVLESTPAEYLGAYGSPYAATPNLDRWSKHAVVFENVYAHAPATNKSLFSILCSLYPWISYKSETEELDLPVPSLASYLRQHGYRTGFFSSSDLSFQGAGDFIRSHGFDFAQDYKQRTTSRMIFRDERWPFLNGSDDISTAESMMSWFGQQHSAGKPVLAMLWTNMTHYPYFTERATMNFGPKKNRFNQYLNALHYDDRAFGSVMDWLETHGLIKTTLVLVVGDHGEAFGQHNQISHAGNIYEENCHVPLLLINPELFNAQRQATVSGLIDVAPTVLQILGYPPVNTWQGESLYSRNHRTRAYFFSPWSDYLFGFREGHQTFIYNATKGTYEMYDVSADPKEQKNLLTARATRPTQQLLHLAAWVQYQDRLLKRLAAHEANPDRP